MLTTCTNCLATFRAVPRTVCSSLATMGKAENTINITQNANACHLISHLKTISNAVLLHFRNQILGIRTEVRRTGRLWWICNICSLFSVEHKMFMTSLGYVQMALPHILHLVCRAPWLCTVCMLLYIECLLRSLSKWVQNCTQLHCVSPKHRTLGVWDSSGGMHIKIEFSIYLLLSILVFVQ